MNAIVGATGGIGVRVTEPVMPLPSAKTTTLPSVPNPGGVYVVAAIPAPLVTLASGLTVPFAESLTRQVTVREGVVTELSKASAICAVTADVWVTRGDRGFAVTMSFVAGPANAVAWKVRCTTLPKSLKETPNVCGPATSPSVQVEDALPAASVACV